MCAWEQRQGRATGRTLPSPQTRSLQACHQVPRTDLEAVASLFQDRESLNDDILGMETAHGSLVACQPSLFLESR